MEVIQCRYIKEADYMLVTLNKWGNSEAIRIPKIITETLGIHCGDKLELTLENDAFIIKKSELRGRELVANLLKDFEMKDTENQEEIEDWDFVAEEVWEYDVFLKYNGIRNNIYL